MARDGEIINEKVLELKVMESQEVFNTIKVVGRFWVFKSSFFNLWALSIRL